MTARTILDLLATRHSKDLFIPECKDGPTQTASHLRLDAWAMRRSWAHPTTYGYEIKVSRGDWLHDEKWTAYLPLCRQFYLACAPGVIDKAEVPPGVGLLEASAKGNRLWMRRRAVERDVPLDEALARYILMCRVQVQQPCTGNDLDFWREWLARRREGKSVGMYAARALREEWEKATAEVREDNSRLQRENDALANIKEIAERWGLPIDGTWATRGAMERKLGMRVLDHIERLREELKRWIGEPAT